MFNVAGAGGVFNSRGERLFALGTGHHKADLSLIVVMFIASDATNLGNPGTATNMNAAL